MSHPLLPWIAERSWFRRALQDDAFEFVTPDGEAKIGSFPRALVHAWIRENPGALGGVVDPTTSESDGCESLAVQIDEVLTLDRPTAELGRFGLRRMPGGAVEWFEEWTPTASGRLLDSVPEFHHEPLRWVSEPSRGSELRGKRDD